MLFWSRSRNLWTLLSFSSCFQSLISHSHVFFSPPPPRSALEMTVCTVRNGATHLTADVQTQPNSDSSTVTVFLNNIIGSPDEIELAVMKDGPFADWFMVNGKQLLLTRSLTQQHQLPEHITLRLRCSRRRLIPTIPVSSRELRVFFLCAGPAPPVVTVDWAGVVDRARVSRVV